ncbi:MAG: LacI family DNA-binding transcriptional regulator [Chloroflexi bacterium]|nr:LacI family DNA-binding transcriptional regulator [Chloroflexota bacterium]
MNQNKTRRSKKSITIVDVAERAGVSVATASRALSGRGYASDAVKERVRRAARDLHYRMNAPARNLKVQRTNTIGLIITNIINPFYSHLANGVLDCANELGYRVLLGVTNEDPDLERVSLKVLLEQRVDGIIAVPTGQNQTLWREAVDMHTRLVLVDREIQGVPQVDAVLVDNVKGACAAITYLIGIGHRRIGMICGSSSTTTGKARVQGYYDAHQSANLPVAPDLMQGDSYNPDSGRRALEALLTLPEPPTAIFASSNILGEVAFSAIRARGLQIPGDLSFIMFDDSPWAALTTPSVSVVSQPTRSLGYVSLKLLDQRIQEARQGNAQAPMKIVMEPELILRESCAPLSGSRPVEFAGAGR